MDNTKIKERNDWEITIEDFPIFIFLKNYISI